MKRATQAAIARVIFGCDCDLIKPRWGAICGGSPPPPFRQPARSGVDLPYGCKYGGCITCAAKLTGGEVDQRRQVALNNRQINQGYVILCVARPLSDITLEIGVESHDRLYRNPFLDPLQSHELKADIAVPKEV